MKQDNPNNRKISVGLGERTGVKQLASLNGVSIHPSKIVLQKDKTILAQNEDGQLLS